MGVIIGIDLGTTNSVCAYTERGEPRIVINEEGGRITPSVVAFSKNGERFVGDVAKRQMLINADATFHSVKRFMGRRYKDAADDIGLVNFKVVEAENGDVGIAHGGRVWSPAEISAMVLQKIKKSAEDFINEKVDRAIITVPAHFTDRQRQATKDAGKIAGLDVIRIINEPTAAALAYLHERPRDATIAVYDFGGGTFDISIVRVAKGVGEVVATRGDNALGGGDLDRLLVDWLLQQFLAQHGIDLSADRVVRQRLRDAAERAKLELSSALETDIQLPFLTANASGPLHLQCTLTRSQFEAMAQRMFERTIEQCRLALADARLDASRIDDVVLVGGSSRIPRVKELVKAFFGRPLNQSVNPDEVVAIGAALQAGVLEGEVKSVTLLDVTSFSLGIEVEGGRFARLIPKNTIIPAQRTQLVSTVAENQRTVKIHVLQGESASAADNTSLGEFELSGIEPGPRGAARIQVKFTIDANGIVNVGARDVGTGREGAIVVHAPTGMSDAQITNARAEAVAHEGAKKAADQLKELRFQLEKQVASLESFVRDHERGLQKLDATEAQHALKRGRMALTKSDDRSNVEETSAWLRRFHAHLSAKVGATR